MESLKILARAMHAQKIVVETAFTAITTAQQSSREMLRGTLERWPVLASKERRNCLIFNDLCLEITAQCRLLTEQGIDGAMHFFSLSSKQEKSVVPCLVQETATSSSTPVLQTIKPEALLAASEPVIVTDQGAALSVPVPLLLTNQRISADNLELATAEVTTEANVQTPKTAESPLRKKVAGRSTAGGKIRATAGKNTGKKAEQAASSPDSNNRERAVSDIDPISEHQKKS